MSQGSRGGGTGEAGGGWGEEDRAQVTPDKVLLKPCAFFFAPLFLPLFSLPPLILLPLDSDKP